MYGISGVALDWIICYLSHRSFRVSVNQETSGECVLEIGLPQGSILGPLLFILHTKDLRKLSLSMGSQFTFMLMIHRSSLPLMPILLTLICQKSVHASQK